MLNNPMLIRREIDRRQRAARDGHPTRRQIDRIKAELLRVQTARSRLIEAYQEGFMDLAELRQRIPRVRQRELALQEQLKNLEARLAGADRYLQLQENLDSFVERLRTTADTLSVPERQRVLRLLVKQVEISADKIVIKHSIPVPDGHSPEDYLLRGRSPFAVTIQYLSHFGGSDVGKGAGSDTARTVSVRGVRAVGG
jgi:site-specific DNA recombinase